MGKRVASLIHLDTHVVAWLYEPRTDLLSRRAHAQIESGALHVSPAVLLELEFLREIGRLSVGSNRIFASLHRQLALQLCSIPFGRVVEAALALDWTRDPFDRLIAAQAAAAGAKLVTRDRTIRKHFPASAW